MVGLTETAVDDEAFAVGADWCLAFDGPYRHMAVDDTTRLGIQTELRKYLPAYLLIVREGEICALHLVVRMS